MMDSFSKRFKFSDWPNPDLPQVAAGVYSIWRDQDLIYCGMSGRNIDSSSTDARAILEKPQKHAFLRYTRTLSSFLIIATLALTTLLLHSQTSLLGSQWEQLLKIQGLSRCFKHSLL